MKRYGQRSSSKTKGRPELTRTQNLDDPHLIKVCVPRPASSPGDAARKIRACVLGNPRSPASAFLTSRAIVYSQSSTVVWPNATSCRRIPFRDAVQACDSYIDARDSVDNGDSPFGPKWPRPFVTFLEHGSYAPRAVSVWHSEYCIRPVQFPKVHRFVRYNAPGDEGTPMIYLPLGPMVLYPFTPRSELQLVHHDFLFNFVVSINTNPLRRSWAAEVNRFTRSAAAKGHRVFVRSGAEWIQPQSDAASVDTKTRLSPEGWHSIASRSAFTLSPSGHSFECFRHWEAAEVGSIPVVPNPRVAAAHLTVPVALRANATSMARCAAAGAVPFRDAPFVFVDNLAEAWPQMIALAADPAALAARRHAVSRWYDDTMITATARVDAVLSAVAAVADVADGRSHSWIVGGDDKESLIVPLVTGGGRSATKEIVEWFNAVGVLAVHEEVKGSAVTVSWAYAAAATARGRMQLKKLGPQSNKLGLDPKAPGVVFGPIVHIVRDPLDHLGLLASCLCDVGDQDQGGYCDQTSYEFAAAVVPAMKNMTRRIIGDSTNRVHLAAVYWLEWNRLANAASSSRFRLEDLDDVALLAALNVSHHATWPLARSLPNMTKDLESSHRFTWEQLNSTLGLRMTADLRARAFEYGYSYEKS